ncbi:SDR family NAD(P)-dependent oxidoreductase [Flexivirga sp. ID2601S]|uniref:SDR family NAD(P)-dependent oxidoreductase n=1 Tax=Flexivirga aerilata TaxID=1656889 RepID=A0A849ADD4_9MICO|nr:SDR family NAD(P)-dependent oxidoreductase [Flexivirga aerilata]NNG38469.1 SDR family NAD(P)-dependent oxidoreductase [Flexivirga aerilata]
MQLSGSVALVTGATGGLGAAIAAAFAGAGARVIVHGRDPRRAARLAAQLDCDHVTGDLRDEPSIGSIVLQANAFHDRIDVLVNNAGIGHHSPFDRMTQAAIDDLVATNLTAPVLLTRAVLPGMLQRGAGHVAFVSSIAGRTAVPGEAVYSATKAGLDAFADALRLEAAGTGVEVSTLVPAVVETGFFATRGAPYTRSRPKPRPANDVARQLVSLIESGRPERFSERGLRVAPVLRAAWPAAYNAMAGRWGERTRLRGGDPE